MCVCVCVCVCFVCVCVCVYTRLLHEQDSIKGTFSKDDFDIVKFRHFILQDCLPTKVKKISVRSTIYPLVEGK